MTDADAYRPQLSQAEVGELLGITRQRVMQLEQRAIQKLRRHPVMKQLAKDWGIIDDDSDQ